MLHSENHAKARFPFHNAGVGAGRLFEGNGLDHGANILENTEFKGALIVDRLAG